MIEEPADFINASDARVFRELLLLIHGDVNRAMCDIAHAKRVTARMRGLSIRAGIGTAKTPITDLLDVAAASLARCSHIVDLGLDAGILVMRDVDDYREDDPMLNQGAEDFDPWIR
jgi:hypothetical protein